MKKTCVPSQQAKFPKNSILSGVFHPVGRVGALLLAAVMLLTMAPVAVLAADTIADGTYSLPLTILHAATANQLSMSDGAVDKDTVRLTVEDGRATLSFALKSLSVGPLTGYLGELYVGSNYRNDGGIISMDTAPATVLSYHDGLTDAFNDPETGTDARMKGKSYPREVSIPVGLGETTTWIQVYVPVMEAIQPGSGSQYARVTLDWDGLVSLAGGGPAAGYVPGIYSGVGQGFNLYGAAAEDPSITVYVQTSATEIVRVFAAPNNQTASYFSNALNGVSAQILEKQGMDGVDAVSGATYSSNGIIEGATAALANAKAGVAATPEETIENIPALMWHASNPAASMMNPLMGENAVATAKRYGNQWTATFRLVPATIMNIPVDGKSVGDNILTADATGQLVNSPVTDTFDDETNIRELTVLLNELKTPLPMQVLAMGNPTTVRLKLVFGIEWDRLEAAIAAAEPKVADEALYTEESFAAFKEAYDAAVALNGDDNADQPQVDAATTNLTSRTAALVLKPRDRTVYTLADLINYVTTDVTNGDVIRLGADLPAVGEELTWADGLRLISYSRVITVEGQGHSIDGQGKYGFFRGISRGDLTLKNIVLKNASVSESGSVLSFSGSQAKATLIDCVIVDNAAGGTYSGVIHTPLGGRAGALFMENCVVIGNQVGGDGGGMYV
ncbi:MAG: NEAT domain-containing protein, partial [Oscillospiraceae bacterium]|nr:NEAT domain-containing protein [Oscillospiraceae bacterium]